MAKDFFKSLSSVGTAESYSHELHKYADAPSPAYNLSPFQGLFLQLKKNH